jgi:hypothetical protein
VLRDRVEKYITNLKNEDLKVIKLYEEEKEYSERHQLISEDIELISKSTRFEDAYIERSEKELENMIAEESSTFLNQPIDYLKHHKNEFIYIESSWFDIIGVDAVSLEMDDLFGVYDVMLGLKLQKKYEKALKANLKNQLAGDEANFDLMFNAPDGLWNLNFALNYVEGFKEDMSLSEAYSLIYAFLFKLVEAVEEEK